MAQGLSLSSGRDFNVQCDLLGDELTHPDGTGGEQYRLSESDVADLKSVSARVRCRRADHRSRLAYQN
ncbi:hypothetical protein O5558_20365 [Escherichia coli]|nr:hypothetical protein [Escherichia coli]